MKDAVAAGRTKTGRISEKCTAHDIAKPATEILAHIIEDDGEIPESAMFRKSLIDHLLDNPMSVAQIARENEVPIKEVATDLDHLRKSLRHSAHTLEVIPARWE